MLERFRQWLFRRALRRLVAAQQRRRRPHTFASAGSVGIVFDAGREQTRKEVFELASTLRKHGKMVRLLGFYDVKNEPAPVQVEKKTDFEFFTRKDLSWIEQPRGEKVSAFLQGKFDLLLSLNPDDLLPLQWLAVQSPAPMKIGMATERLNDFDLAIETPRERGIRYFIEQLNLYLDKIVLSKHEPAAAH